MIRFILAGLLIAVCGTPSFAQQFGARDDSTRHATLAQALAAGLMEYVHAYRDDGAAVGGRRGPRFALALRTRDLDDDLVSPVRTTLFAHVPPVGARGTRALGTFALTLTGPQWFGAARDTAQVTVEWDWRPPCPGGPSWVNAFRYVFVRDALGWRFAQRVPALFRDGEIRC